MTKVAFGADTTIRIVARPKVASKKPPSTPFRIASMNEPNPRERWKGLAFPSSIKDFYSSSPVRLYVRAQSLNREESMFHFPLTCNLFHSLFFPFLYFCVIYVIHIVQLKSYIL